MKNRFATHHVIFQDLKNSLSKSRRIANRAFKWLFSFMNWSFMHFQVGIFFEASTTSVALKKLLSFMIWLHVSFQVGFLVMESVHEGKKPFLCSTCDASFTQKPDLKEHMESVHEGKKSFLCNTCDALLYTQTRQVLHWKGFFLSWT